MSRFCCRMSYLVHCSAHDETQTLCMIYPDYALGDLAQGGGIYHNMSQSEPQYCFVYYFD